MGEDEPLESLRQLCLALPEVTERISHGEPTWFIRGKKTFVMFADHHHDERLAFWCAAPPGAQEAFIASAPARYFRPPYVGVRGWLGVYLDVLPTDWDEIADLVEDAYRCVAPRTLLAQLDAPQHDYRPVTLPPRSTSSERGRRGRPGMVMRSPAIG